VGAAVINLDVTNVRGNTRTSRPRDRALVARPRSGAPHADVSAHRDPIPPKGRSSVPIIFPAWRAGLSIESGAEHVDRPAGWAGKADRYNATTSRATVRADFADGMVQQVRRDARFLMVAKPARFRMGVLTAEFDR
jgi:hypothetical protein